MNIDINIIITVSLLMIKFKKFRIIVIFISIPIIGFIIGKHLYKDFDINIIKYLDKFL